MSKVAVTGASGYIGTIALDRLSSAGHDCVTLGRQTVGNFESRPFSLEQPCDPKVFDGVNVLMHCAWDLTVTAPADVYRRNVVGTTELFRAAVTTGVRRIVFISSMSAYPGTTQLYGRSKLEVEEQVRELGGVSLRLGLVWGGSSPGGMAGAVQRLTALPIVPVLGGDKSYQYMVHRDDVAEALRLGVEQDGITGVVGVANPTRVALPDLLRGLSQQSGASRTGRLVAIPWQPIYGAMRSAEAMRVPLPLRADSVLGLGRPAPKVPGVEVWSEFGLRLRPFSPTAGS